MPCPFSGLFVLSEVSFACILAAKGAFRRFGSIG
jgi:hypothetical protein